MKRVNVFAINRCINEGYGLIRIFTEKIRISPTELWRVCPIELIGFISRFISCLLVCFDIKPLAIFQCAEADRYFRWWAVNAVPEIG